jgi:hypothetical protein
MKTRRGLAASVARNSCWKNSGRAGLGQRYEPKLLATKSSIREVLKMQICQNEVFVVLLAIQEVLFGYHE